MSVKTFKTRTVHLFFRLCLCYTNVNYRAWHVYKPLSSSSVATNRLACSEIFLSINKNKAGVTPGKWSDIVQTGKPL